MAIKERPPSADVDTKHSDRERVDPDHITLSEEDSTVLTNALENPPEPNDYLVQAMREYYGKA